MKSKIPAALILSLGVGLAGYFIGQGFIDSRSHTQSVEVKGLAERVVKSNEAVWTINIKLVDNDLSKLYESVSRSQMATKQFLISQGFKETEIFMNPPAVTDNQSLTYNQNQGIPRFSADSGVTISSVNVDLVADALQKTGNLVEQGVVVTSSNAVFRFTNLNQIKRPMLEEATKSARNAAESFAQDSKTSLGKIRHASQGQFTITDANSNYDTGNAELKKVRIVTTIEYELKD
jgi:hypothetical protein